MPELAPCLHPLGARADGAFAGEAAAAVVAAVALAAPLPRAAEMLIQRAAAPFVGPDVAIDRLVTDREPAGTAQPAPHLLRTPILPQELLDLRPFAHSEVSISPGTGAAAAGVPLRELGAIRPLARGPGALHLPRPGASMAPHD